MKAIIKIVAMWFLPVAMCSAGQWVYGNYTNLWGTRNYQVWIPTGYQAGADVPMVVALHGCTQNPSQYAGLSRLNGKADREKFIVLYPNQATYANASQCWNWMLTKNQSRNSGEVSIIMGMVSRIKSRYSIDDSRVYVKGVSGGAAMTAILMACHSDVFAAGASVAGAMYKAATTISGSAYALLNGSIYHPANRGRDAWECSGRPRGREFPMLVFQGDEDTLVNPINAEELVQQVLQTNDYADDGADNDSISVYPVKVVSHVSPRGRSYLSEHYQKQGSDLVVKYTMKGAGHAYPGGDPSFLFADPYGPDATEIIWDFFLGKTR